MAGTTSAPLLACPPPERWEPPQLPACQDCVVREGEGGVPSRGPHPLVSVVLQAGAAAVARAAAGVASPPLCVLCVGELGIGNTTAAAAVLAALTGAPPEEVCGRGTGEGPSPAAAGFLVFQSVARSGGGPWARRCRRVFRSLCHPWRFVAYMCSCAWPRAANLHGSLGACGAGYGDVAAA